MRDLHALTGGVTAHAGRRWSSRAPALGAGGGAGGPRRRPAGRPRGPRPRRRPPPAERRPLLLRRHRPAVVPVRAGRGRGDPVRAQGRRARPAGVGARRDRRPAVAQGPAAAHRRALRRPAGALGLELDVLPVTSFRRLEKLLPGGGVRGRRPRRSCGSGRSSRRGRSSASARRRPSPTRSAASSPASSRRGSPRSSSPAAWRRRRGGSAHEGYIRMRGFNQEMFYGQLLTGVSGCVPSYLDTPLAGTGLSPSVAQGASFRRIGRGRAGRVRLRARARRLHGGLHAHVLDRAAGARSSCDAYDAALRVQEAATGGRPAGRGLPRRVGGGAGGRRAPAWPRSFMGHGAGQVPYVGHGIGIELDELPVLTGSGLELEAGMVFALEPKFVLPGLGRHRHREHLGRHRARGGAAHAGARDDLVASSTREIQREAGKSEPAGSGDATGGGTHEAAGAGRVGARHRRRGVPDAVGGRPHAAPGDRRRHAHRPRRDGSRARLPRRRRPATAAPLVVNTHHHWDHVFGNAAFAGADIVAQRGCPRLIQARAAGR